MPEIGDFFIIQLPIPVYRPYVTLNNERVVIKIFKHLGETLIKGEFSLN